MDFVMDPSPSHSLSEVESEQDNARKRTLREKTRRQATASLRAQQLQKDNFLDDFDPETSKREKRKLKRKLVGHKHSVYDVKGRIRDNLIDVCDCLNMKCLGCFFPCTNCKNCKCGPSCRTNRKFAYDLIEFDGNNDMVRNNFIYIKV